jgi:hypothetical protein
MEREIWEPWILYMLAAMEETARWTCGKILAIRDLLEETVSFCREKLPRRVRVDGLAEV